MIQQAALQIYTLRQNQIACRLKSTKINLAASNFVLMKAPSFFLFDAKNFPRDVSKIPISAENAK
jgi:hypothetical protein